jgi:aspartate racemase
MSPKSIGIVGGAGPLAGAYLLEKIVLRAGEAYGCYKDADFPLLFLISFPFSDMLSPEVEPQKLRQELKRCLKHLRRSGAAVLGIACNTLHAFLDEDEADDLVQLPRLLAAPRFQSGPPLALCTSTAIRFEVHRRCFPCVYPDPITQRQVDEIIDQVLRGGERSAILRSLTRLIEAHPARAVILGCTELSLFASQLSVPGKIIIDPLELMANELLTRSFRSEESR